MQTHQVDGVAFRSVLPEDIEAFPPSARLAVVVGEPTEPGPYTIRVKLPSDVKLMPHRHPEDRVTPSKQRTGSVRAFRACRSIV